MRAIVELLAEIGVRASLRLHDHESECELLAYVISAAFWVCSP